MNGSPISTIESMDLQGREERERIPSLHFVGNISCLFRLYLVKARTVCHSVRQFVFSLRDGDGRHNRTSLRPEEAPRVEAENIYDNRERCGEKGDKEDSGLVDWGTLQLCFASSLTH